MRRMSALARAQQTAEQHQAREVTTARWAHERRGGQAYRGPLGTLLVLLALAVLAALTACASARVSGAAANGSPGAAPTTISSCPPAASSAPGDRLSHAACLAVVKLAGQVATTYDAQHHSAQVEVTFVGTRVPRSDQQIGAAQEAVKTICYRTQRALWTSGIPLTQVTVMVQGPILGDFFDVETDWYGGTRVTARTAEALDWQSLGADGAWTRFDQVWLRTGFAPNQYYSSTPRATP